MNEVEIIVTSKDLTKAGFRSVNKELKDLAGEVEETTKSTERLRDEFGRFKKAGESATEATKKSLGGLPGVVGDAGSKAGSAFSKAFTSGVDKISETLPKALTNPAVLAAAAPAAAFVGAAAGGALVGGFGAGIAGIGMVAAAGSSEVKNEFSDLGSDLGREMSEISTPFRQTFLDISDQARTSFGSFRPALASAFRDLAPEVSAFTGHLFDGLGEFESAIDPITDAFSALLQDLGPRLPGVIDGIADSMTNLAESIEKNPAALGDFVEFMGNAIEFMMDELRGLNDLWAEVSTDFGEEFGTLLDFDNNVAPKFREIADSLGITARSADVAKRSSQELESAFDDIASSASDVTSRGDAMVRMLDIISGRSPSYQEATQTINDSIRDLGERFGNAKNHVDGYGSALLNADGTVSTITGNGSFLADQLDKLQGGFADTAAATRELEDAGWTHDAAVNKVNGDLALQRDALLATGEKMGLTKSQMEKLLATYGLTPELLMTLIQADDKDFKDKVAAATAPATKTITLWYNDPGAGRHSGNGWGVGGDAHGGIVGGAADGGIKPGLKWVGEHGAELVKLPAGSQVIPSNTSRNMVEQSRNMFQGYEDSYNYGEITDELWKRLMDQGWRGDPTDRAERIYKPGSMPKQAWSGYNDSYDYGEITDELWERLKSQGWKGNPNDGAERIYKPSTRSGGQGSSIGGGGRTVLEIRSGGSRLDDLLVELLRKAVQQQGGDVQTVLGGDRW